MKENKFIPNKYGNSSNSGIINNIKSNNEYFNISEEKLNKPACLALVKKDSKSFAFVKDIFKKDKDVALLAIKDNPSMYRYMSYDLKNNYKFIMKCMESNPLIYAYLQGELKNNKNIIWKFLKAYPEKYFMIPFEYKKDKELFLFTFKKHPEIVNLIDPSLVEDDDVFKEIKDFVTSNNIENQLIIYNINKRLRQDDLYLKINLDTSELENKKVKRKI